MCVSYSVRNGLLATSVIRGSPAVGIEPRLQFASNVIRFNRGTKSRDFVLKYYTQRRTSDGYMTLFRGAIACLLEQFG